MCASLRGREMEWDCRTGLKVSSPLTAQTHTHTQAEIQTHHFKTQLQEKQLTFSVPAIHVTFPSKPGCMHSSFLSETLSLLSYMCWSGEQTKKSRLQNARYSRWGCKTEPNWSVSMQSITLHLLSSSDFPLHKASWIIKRSLLCQLLHLRLSRINIQSAATIHKKTRSAQAKVFPGLKQEESEDKDAVRQTDKYMESYHSNSRAHAASLSPVSPPATNWLHSSVPSLQQRQSHWR